MKKFLIIASATLVFASACGGRGEDLSREQQQYETVQEGAATGVTSTIVAGGEAPPPAMTGTGADTTTSFTLPNTASLPPGQQQPGSLAGTLPAERSSYPTPTRPRPVTPPPSTAPTTPQPTPVPEPVPQPTMTTPTETQPAEDSTEQQEDEPEQDDEQLEEPAPPPPPPGV